MAVVGTSKASAIRVPTWHWRAEWTLLARAFRSAHPYLLALLAIVATTLAYQSRQPIGVQVGGGYDAPYVHGFFDREARDGIRYRWATGRARVLLPGVGARPSTLVITAGARPDGAREPVQVVVNGIPLGQFVPAPQPRPYRFDLPARGYSYGDLTVDLLSVPQLVQGRGATVVGYGPKVLDVYVETAPGAGVVKPALWPLLAWTISAPLLYFILLRLGVGPALAAGGGAVALLAAAAATRTQRLDLALFAPRVAFLLASAYVLLILSDLAIPRLFARGGVVVDARAWRLLQLTGLFVYVLKLGGIAYPQLFVIDQPWHDQQFEKVLSGRFLELYRPGAGGISSLPGQWGIPAEIPYPPFLYLVGLPFYLGPLGRDLSINFWSGLFDVSRVFILFYLARRLGASTRAALIAAFIIGLTASTFLLHSWGNYPTTISQYTALLFLTLLVARYDALRRPAVFAGLATLLVLTMLLYTVTAVFIGVLLVLLLIGIAWRGTATARHGLAPLSLLLLSGSLIALFAYYVQYVGPVIAQTLPAFQQQLAAGQALGVKATPLPTYAARYVAHLWEYGIVVTLLLAPFGAWVLLRRSHHDLAGPLLAAWFAVFASFALVGTRIDMVSKEIWFVLPAAALGAGVACDALLARWTGRLGRGAVALYLAHLTWGGVTLWLVRIISVRH